VGEEGKELLIKTQKYNQEMCVMSEYAMTGRDEP
jgi:hypothetical protein